MKPFTIEHRQGPMRVWMCRFCWIRQRAMIVRPLDGAGRPLGAAFSAQPTPDGWVVNVGDVATTWYEIIVKTTSA